MAERQAKGHRFDGRWPCRDAVDSKLSFLDETEIEALMGAALLLPFLTVMFHGFMRVQIDLRCEREYRKKAEKDTDHMTQ